MNGTKGGAAAAAVKGAVAGAVGVWLMALVCTAMYEQEDEAAKVREEAARVEGKDPASVAAGRLARAAGAPLTGASEGQVATGIHYALGVLPGAAYGVLRHHLGDSGTIRGLAYGLVLFPINDEAIGSALGLAAGPTEYPWQVHARGLTAHLVLGVATDAVLDVLDWVGERAPAVDRRYRGTPYPASAAGVAGGGGTTRKNRSRAYQGFASSIGSTNPPSGARSGTNRSSALSRPPMAKSTKPGGRAIASSR